MTAHVMAFQFWAQAESVRRAERHGWRWVYTYQGCPHMQFRRTALWVIVGRRGELVAVPMA